MDDLNVSDLFRRDSGWIYGMKNGGICGLFKSDYVSAHTTPLDDIKAKLASGEVSARNVSISSPTDVDHMMHVGHDGTKWISENLSHW